MSITLYTATGCVRCKMVRHFLKDRGLTYRDHDARGEGKGAFRSFYQANRQKIYRGADGVEFPLYCDCEATGRSPGNQLHHSEEVAQAAQLIETATGDNRQPYGLRFLDPKNADDERLRTCEALSSSALFQYRTLARKYQFKTEILKE